MKKPSPTPRGEALRAALLHLSESIGPRHLGSEGERMAVDYLEKCFLETGAEVVLETFATPGWRCGAHEVLLADGGAVDAAPCYFSPGGVVRAPLRTFWPQRDAAGSLDRFAGAVAFAGNYDFAQVADTNELAERLERAGAAAFLINSPYNDTYSTKIVRSPNLRTMPVFTVSQRTALRLAREEGNPVSLRLEAETFDHSACNVVARHRASGSSRGKLVIGAHYDTSPGIPGAADNASGVAVLLELARALRDCTDGWDVDFVAFGGEEYGGPGYGIGGFSYWQAHHLEPIRAMVCLDGFGTYLTIPEARVGRSEALRALVRTQAVKSGLQILPFRRGSDQGIFHDNGIPTLWLCDGGAANGVRHYPLHSPQDAPDLIDFQKLENLADDAEAVLRALLLTGLEEPTWPDIEGARPEHFDEIVALARSVWTMGADCLREKTYGRLLGAPWQEKIAASVRDYLGRPDVRAFQIRRNDQLAGFVSCRVDGETGLAEIGYNAVDTRFLGGGLGKTLLRHVLTLLRREGHREVEVVTGMDSGHAPARALYEGAGFKPLVRSVRYTVNLDETFPDIG